MALSCAISQGYGAGSVVAGRTVNFVLSISNTNATSVTLQSVQVTEATESDATVSPPTWMTPNVPPGVGNPILLPGTTVSFGFQAVFNSPMQAGPSPNNPGGASAASGALTPDAFFALQAICQTSDGSVFSSTFLVPVLSTIAPFSVPEGGALYFTQGANLMTLTMLGAL